jgi:large subunit ribosomal protein L7/L12
LSWLKRNRSAARAQPARPAALQGPFPAGAPGDQFDVLLTDVGERKIQVIKEVRAIACIGLKEAKERVADRAAYGPVVITTRLSSSDANSVALALSACGATVTVQPSTQASGLDRDAQAASPQPVAAWPMDPRRSFPADQAGDQFVVVLTAAGDRKIQVIKLIRECTGYGLKDAKDLVDASAYRPVVITRELRISDANQLAAALTSVGATVAVTVPPAADTSALHCP